MNTNTLAAHAGRLAGHAWLALQQIDWAEAARIVGHGLIAFAVIVYMAGHALGTAVHRANDALAAWASRRHRGNVEQAPAPIQAIAPIVEQAPTVPAPPAVQLLYVELAHLPVSKLRTIAGTRSKRYRRTELLAMVAA
jgi:hypothetical protein